MSIHRVFCFSALSAAALAAVLSYARPSSADALPPNSCSGGAGVSCDNAGPNLDEPGICVETMCAQHGGEDAGVHAEGGADASAPVVEEPCVLCQVPNDDASPGATPSKSSGGGCSASGSQEGLGIGLMIAAAVGVGALQRRRRAA